MPKPIDLFAYHDLSRRIGVFSTAGGEQLSGDAEDLQIVDAEPAYAEGEQEIGRIAGAVQLIGPRSVKDDPEPTLGLVLSGAAVAVLTSERAILMVQKGQSTAGSVDGETVQTFVLPWDLVDIVGMPVKKSMTDRIAGERTIDVFCASIFLTLNLTPFYIETEGGGQTKIKGEDAMSMLVDAAVRQRWGHSPPEHHDHLARLINGQFEVEDGEYMASITPDGSRGDDELPAHLQGRVVVREQGPEPDAAPEQEPQGQGEMRQGPSPTTAAPAATAFCTECGHSMGAEDRFCRACGAEVRE